MLITLRVLFLVNIIALQCWSAARTQYSSLPAVACPDYFEYQAADYGYTGRITVYQLPIGRAQVRAFFSNRGLRTSGYNGRITPYPTQQIAINNVLTGRPVKFHIDFADPTNPPKITHLSLNDGVLCSDSKYPLPSSWYELVYTLDTYLRAVGFTQPYIIPPPVADSRNNFTRTTYILTPNHLPQNTRPVVISGLPIEFVPRETFNVRPEEFRNLPEVQTPRPQPVEQIEANNLDEPATPSTDAPLPASADDEKMQSSPAELSSVCGAEGAVLRSFISGGTDVIRGQFPWLTAIYRAKAEGLNFICGGSLISSRAVISAAHCFKRLKSEQIVAFLGRYNLETYTEDGVVTRNVEQLIVHPEFDYKTMRPDVDLAILQIQKLESYTRYIKPICLWSESTDVTFIANKPATITGWGSNSTSSDVLSLPKMLDVSVVSEEQCKESSPTLSSELTNGTICAGNRDGNGPCLGDSGNGLMLYRSGRWLLRGIVSAALRKTGNKCNLSEYVIYCDVAQHITWVHEHMLN